MTRKEKIRLVRILIFAGLLVGGGLVFARFEPELRKKQFPNPIKSVEEKIEETKIGKMALKILGVETEKETESEDAEKKKEEEEEKEQKLDIVETVKEEISDVIMEKSSEKIIEILKTLPPEEFEKLKKDLQEEICE